MYKVCFIDKNITCYIKSIATFKKQNCNDTPLHSNTNIYKSNIAQLMLRFRRKTRISLNLRNSKSFG